ncbi:MAG: carbohydrate-binding family 9-like protein [Planctomycetales bacterium]|nr:carbohydrate-binding family 9-like protein [bacterium]UNM07331.1 MAG: carbohydrate-binding family 9-like protein [Planctomycetales bacterium]
MNIPRQIIATAVCCASLVLATLQQAMAVTRPDIEFAPRTYQCVKAYASPVIDGLNEDVAWKNAGWSEYFVDITGDEELEPYLPTRFKMLWDDRALYLYAEIAEPNIQGSLTDRDSVIYHDNDFELFIDPDADNHLYAELEVNALGTVWDLLLDRPYRDGGEGIDGWDIKGLELAVSLDGTVNDASDVDQGWSVELAIPWDALAELTGGASPPETGDRWKINFSRVQYHVTVDNGEYLRDQDGNGQPLDPENWVWSPQGVVAMHCPEMWGVVEFAGGIVVPGKPELNSEEYARQALMCMYYWQRDYHDEHGEYSGRKVERWYADYPLPDVDNFREWLVQDAIWASPSQFRFSMSNGERTLSVDETGRVSSFNGPLRPVEYEEIPEDELKAPELESEVGPPEATEAEEEAARSSTDGRETPPEGDGS